MDDERPKSPRGKPPARGGKPARPREGGRERNPGRPASAKRPGQAKSGKASGKREAATGDRPQKRFAAAGKGGDWRAERAERRRPPAVRKDIGEAADPGETAARSARTGREEGFTRRKEKDFGRPGGGHPPRRERPSPRVPHGERGERGEARGDRGDRRPGRAERASSDARPAKPSFTDRKEKDFGRPGGGHPPRRDRVQPRRAFAGGEGARKAAPAPSDASVEEGERIARRLARAGIASRRDAEELVAAGRIKVNGKVLSSPAVNVRPGDRIELDGTEIPPIERTRLFLFNKPAGVVTTNRDPEGRRTVFDVLPDELPRLMTIGRLDINTEGLLLLTNDGGLSRVLELPATGWLRRYRVRVHGKVDEKALAGLKDGMAVDGVFYGAIDAALDREQGSNAWLTLGLREGKNREVRNVLGALGLEVSRLIRISYGPFQLGELPEGHVLEIKGRMLRDQLGERLIEEAGANFEAEIVKPFSNRPERREYRSSEAERPKIARDGERGRIGEGGLIKKRRKRENGRDEALGKLSTRPERSGEAHGKKRHDAKPQSGAGRSGGRPEADGRGKGGKRERQPLAPPGGRSSNVWMAPGARPMGARPDRTAEAGQPRSRPARQDAGDGERPKSPRGEGPGKPRRPGKGGHADRRR